MSKGTEEYDWIDDPFNDSKNDDLARKGMGKGAKAFIGIGIVAVVILLVLGFGGVVQAIMALAS